MFYVGVGGGDPVGLKTCFTTKGAILQKCLGTTALTHDPFASYFCLRY